MPFEGMKAKVKLDLVVFVDEVLQDFLPQIR